MPTQQNAAQDNYKQQCATELRYQTFHHANFRRIIKSERKRNIQPKAQGRWKNPAMRFPFFCPRSALCKFRNSIPLFRIARRAGILQNCRPELNRIGIAPRLVSARPSLGRGGYQHILRYPHVGNLLSLHRKGDGRRIILVAANIRYGDYKVIHTVLKRTGL